MPYRSTPNETQRLILGAIATGTFWGADQLKAEYEHPCQARTIDLDIDHSTILAAIKKRQSYEFRLNLIRSLIAILFVAGILAFPFAVLMFLVSIGFEL